MIWSISEYKQFNNCRRQWYYGNIVADARVKKDAYRRELTILSKLQTIDAWRGSIVDDVVSRLLVTAINNKYSINKSYFLKEAMSLFEKQLEFAVFQKYREENRRLASGDPEFAAILEYDFGLTVSKDQIEKAKNDVNEAISNLIDDKEFIDYLKSARFLISQRPLVYNFDRFSVKAIPDMIAFFDNSPPHIFDWKVHTYGLNTYDQQLISYAVALYKVNMSKPHVDFPKDLSKYEVYDYKLTEYQLLHGDRLKRDYDVTKERIEELGGELTSSIIEMYMAGCHKKYSEVHCEDFSTTPFVENCNRCPFQKVCKEEEYEIRDEHFQD